MKIIKYYIRLTLLLLSVFSVSSCDKFLDVQPKTQVREDKFFQNEQGFQEALNGVYLNIGNANLYGRNLTYGFADALAGMYVETGLTPSYIPVFQNVYTDATFQGFTASLWLSAYNNIANVNNLINKIEVADRSMFTNGNYERIRGEALALRALIHFDLFRIFGTTTINGGDNLPSIPYRTLYNATVVGKMTGKVVKEKIAADLLAAAEYLKADPIITLSSGLPAAAERRLRMNYFAVNGLMARFYLWNNEPEKALIAAEKVINSQKFPFVTINALLPEDPNKDRTFITEQLFAIYNQDILTNYANLLVVNSATSTGLLVNDDRLNQQYEVIAGSGGTAGGIGATDVRYRFLTQKYSLPQGTFTLFTKLFQPEVSTAALHRRIPVLKLAEMYYIAAECLKNSDPVKAIGYLNTVRTNRSITTALPTTLNADQIQLEIRKEYWKEMPLEGQMFFYYKRNNSTVIPGKQVSFAPALYTIPLPPNEQEFGF